MPPPSLSGTTTVRSGAVSPSPSSRPVRSCRKVRSPISANAGPPVRACTSAAPTAVEIVPSMPATPRLASTVRSPPRHGQPVDVADRRRGPQHQQRPEGQRGDDVPRQPGGGQPRRGVEHGVDGGPDRAATPRRHPAAQSASTVPASSGASGNPTPTRALDRPASGHRGRPRRSPPRLRVGEQRGDRPGQRRPPDDDARARAGARPASRAPEQQRPAAQARRGPRPAARLGDHRPAGPAGELARRPGPRTPARRRRPPASAPPDRRRGRARPAWAAPPSTGRRPRGRPTGRPAPPASSSGISGSRSARFRCTGPGSRPAHRTR